MMNKLHVAVVGCGNISGIYFENLTTVFQNIEIVAICDLDADKVSQASQKYHIQKIMTLDEILRADDIDIVLNITTPQTH